MAMFKAVATEQLKVLFFIYLLGNGFNAAPAANPSANACGSEFFYPDLLTKQYLLLVEIFLSAMLLLAVRVAINAAEAGAISDARAAASTRGWAFDADHEATVMGLAAVPAGKMESLRLLLHLAVQLSGRASFLAIAAFEDGYHYRTGCHDDAPYRAGGPFYILMEAALHGFYILLDRTGTLNVIFFSIGNFEGDYKYPYRVGWPFYILMCLMAVVHGFSVWVAEKQN